MCSVAMHDTCNWIVYCSSRRASEAMVQSGRHRKEMKPGDASLEFEGGVTRRGKMVLGGAAGSACYAAGVPWWANTIVIAGFVSWAVLFRDVQADHDKFRRASCAAGLARSEDTGNLKERAKDK